MCPERSCWETTCSGIQTITRNLNPHAVEAALLHLAAGPASHLVAPAASHLVEALGEVPEAPQVTPGEDPATTVPEDLQGVLQVEVGEEVEVVTLREVPGGGSITMEHTRMVLHTSINAPTGL